MGFIADRLLRIKPSPTIAMANKAAMLKAVPDSDKALTPAQVSAFLNYVGLGYQFAVLGAIVHRNARARGIGRDLPTDWFTEDVNP